MPHRHWLRPFSPLQLPHPQSSQHSALKAMVVAHQLQVPGAFKFGQRIWSMRRTPTMMPTWSLLLHARNLSSMQLRCQTYLRCSFVAACKSKQCLTDSIQIANAFYVGIVHQIHIVSVGSNQFAPCIRSNQTTRTMMTRSMLASPTHLPRRTLIKMPVLGALVQTPMAAAISSVTSATVCEL